MIDVEPLIVSELERMLPVPDAGRADWRDVLRRAGIAARHRRSQPGGRRPVLALVGAIVLVFLTAAAIPAFGLTHTVINWFSTPAAPGPTQEIFAQLDIGAPAGMAPGVSGAARSVMEMKVAGQSVDLWVAPTKGGGFCYILESYGGTCDRDRSLAVNPTLGAHTISGPAVVFGDALSDQVDHLELRYADGGTASIPVTHVSAPIDASFFIYPIPASRSQSPFTLAAIGADGSTLGTANLRGVQTGPPPP